jgi:capsule biosynthesis phosphatase
MDIIIPLGGLGNRFKKFNYNRPKPLINVMGQPIIHWLLNSLDLSKINNVIIPYNKELSQYRFESQLTKDFPKVSFKFKKLETDTRGASETLLEALKLLDYDSPVLCIDGDSFFLENVIEKWNGENCVYIFESHTKEPLFSYSKVQDNKIVDIKEKEKISNLASAGIYGFKSSKLLKEYCEKIIKNNIKQKNEFYTSGVIKEMINDGHDIRPKFINYDNMICLGTPMHLRLFCNNYQKTNSAIKELIKTKRYCFDLDNTLVTYPKIKNDYSSVLPIENNIKIVRLLKKMGNEIIIHTARRMKTHKGNVGKVVSDIAKVTIVTLEKFNIPYDELYFGKPYADYYVDDLAISAYSDLEKELGFYNTDIDPRDFNRISVNKMEICKKVSTKDLSGEIHYYQSLPKKIKSLFPVILNCDENNKFYEMEKIKGIPVSKLYLAGELSKGQLCNIMDSVRKIHECEYLKEEVNIYENYSKKLSQRYSEYDYSSFKDSDQIFNGLNNKLIEYENNSCGKTSIIHGDPVFTNILINEFGQVKFIDPRGKLGDSLTILGDSLYDWAKVYQSLIGYDEILENIQVNTDYKNYLISVFEEKFLESNTEKDLSNLKLITKSLLFTLIPLHNNEKCEKYYNLINYL